MAMTNNQMNLVRAIAENRLHHARSYAALCCSEDTSQKNRSFTSHYQKVLENKIGKDEELPYQLKGMAVKEDTSSFEKNRYILSDEAKSVVEEALRARRVCFRMQELGIEFTNSILLHGKSGCGKTTLAKYIAYKLGVPIIYLNFSKLIDSHMGATSKNISQIFEYAEMNPCVFMLDEVDCISTNRSKENSDTATEVSRITITLMQEMDRLPPETVVIAATNRIDLVDAALLRRFRIKREIGPLSKEENSQFVHSFYNDVSMAPSQRILDLCLTPNITQSALRDAIIEDIMKRIEEEEEKKEN